MAKRCYFNSQICKGKHKAVFYNKYKTRDSNPRERDNRQEVCVLDDNGGDHDNGGSQSDVTFCKSGFSHVTTMLQTLVVKINRID